jgi:hypothetical protein
MVPLKSTTSNEFKNIEVTNDCHTNLIGIQEYNMVKNTLNEFMKSAGAPEKYQNNNIKTIISFAKFLGPNLSFPLITKREPIIKFLDTKIKDTAIDLDKQ